MKTPMVLTPKKTHKSSNDNNWVVFAIHTIVSFIIVITYGLIGSNFMHLLGIAKNGDEATLVKNFTPFYNYTHHTNDYKTVFKWVFDVLNTSYDTNLKGLVTAMSKLGNILEGHTNIQAMLSLVPFALIPVISIAIFGSNWFYMFYEGFWWSLVGLFLMYSFVVNSCISIVQIFQYIYIFLLFPMVSNSTESKKNIKSMQMSLSLLFGLLVCISAFLALNSYISITMSVMYVCWIIKQFI